MWCGTGWPSIINVTFILWVIASKSKFRKKK
jgi:hypothetical protein